MSTPKHSAPGVLAFAASATQATNTFLRPEEAAASPDTTVDTTWRYHTPLLADAGVSFLNQAGQHVQGLQFTAQGLLDETQRLLQVQSAREALEQEVRRLITAETLHKNRISEWVGTLDQAITARRIDPSVSQPVKAAVALAAAPFVAIGEHYQEAQTSQRRATLSMKQQLTDAQSAAAHKDLVIRSLQGEPLKPAELAPTAPRKRARRSRR